MPVIPSVKYHLPVDLGDVSLSEYEHTTAELLGIWADVGCGGPMLLEKDLSPTLAGDDRATHRATILAWLRNVTGWVSGKRLIRWPGGTVEAWVGQREAAVQEQDV